MGQRSPRFPQGLHFDSNKISVDLCFSVRPGPNPVKGLPKKVESNGKDSKDLNSYPDTIVSLTFLSQWYTECIVVHSQGSFA